LREDKKADPIEALIESGMVASGVKAGPSEVLHATNLMELL
jgi:hypothetical protein